MYYFDLSKHTRRVVSAVGLGGYTLRRSPGNGEKNDYVHNKI